MEQLFCSDTCKSFKTIHASMHFPCFNWGVGGRGVKALETPDIPILRHSENFKDRLSPTKLTDFIEPASPSQQKCVCYKITVLVLVPFSYVVWEGIKFSALFSIGLAQPVQWIDNMIFGLHYFLCTWFDFAPLFPNRAADTLINRPRQINYNFESAQCAWYCTSVYSLYCLLP